MRCRDRHTGAGMGGHYSRPRHDGTCTARTRCANVLWKRVVQAAAQGHRMLAGTDRITLSVLNALTSAAGTAATETRPRGAGDGHGHMEVQQREGARNHADREETHRAVRPWPRRQHAGAQCNGATIARHAPCRHTRRGNARDPADKITEM